VSVQTSQKLDISDLNDEELDILERALSEDGRGARGVLSFPVPAIHVQCPNGFKGARDGSYRMPSKLCRMCRPATKCATVAQRFIPEARSGFLR
jgi:hypothetical protein